MIGMIQDISTMHDVLHESKTGLWIIEIEDGRQPRMFEMCIRDRDSFMRNQACIPTVQRMKSRNFPLLI